eukprot:gene550-297_t
MIHTGFTLLLYHLYSLFTLLFSLSPQRNINFNSFFRLVVHFVSVWPSSPLTQPSGVWCKARSGTWSRTARDKDTSTWFPYLSGIHPILVHLMLQRLLFLEGMPKDEIAQAKYAALMACVAASNAKDSLDQEYFDLGLMMGVYHATHKHEINGSEMAFLAARTNTSNGMEGFKEYVDAMPTKPNTVSCWLCKKKGHIATA